MHTAQQDPFAAFRLRLTERGIPGLRAGIIGKDARFDGPFGERTVLYADYVASGRALSQVEAFMLSEVLPYYANTHTEASETGARTTRLREAARRLIARACGADDEHAVIFAGSGATAGLNRLVHLLGVAVARAEGRPVLVLHGPYEHHSNILPWRESGAEVAEIPEAPTGGPDLAALEARLAATPLDTLIIGTFSAASNVTGIVTDVVAVTRLLGRYGARSVWDYGGAGPYLPIAMRPAPGAHIDAIAVSPHKFTGGPGASGVLIVRRSACIPDVPTWPGGGTVRYVSARVTDYSRRLEDREEAGTPNVLGDIRAGLAFAVKEAIGVEAMARRHAELADLGIRALARVPGVTLLGPTEPERLPILSMTFAMLDGTPVHHQYATRLLSDLHGIQARGGCACAGPYAHRLLGLDAADEAAIRAAAADGRELDRPGFVRVNLSVLMSEAEVSRILGALASVPEMAARYRSRYWADPVTGLFAPYPQTAPSDRIGALLRGLLPRVRRPAWT